MNSAIRRRLCWLSIIFAAALSITAPQSLFAQSQPGEQPAAGPAEPGQLKTVAVLAGARYEKLIGDIAFLGSFAGKPEAGQMVEGGLSFFTQGKGANAIDKSKPWGLIVQTDGAGFYPVGCLPISKIDDVLDVAKAYGADVKDGENGTKQLALPNGKSFYVKPQNDVVFISIAAASLAKLPANPQEILAKKVGEYDVLAVVSVKNIPEAYREFALKAMEAGMQQGMKKLPNESDEQFADRQRLAEGQMAQMTRMINEIDTVTIGWAVDAPKQRTFFDFTYQFLPGSKMAERIAMYANTHTNFAGFYQPDAGASLRFATQADPKLIAEDLAQFESMMKNLREQTNKEIDKNEKIGDSEMREALKGAANDVFDAMADTIKEGQIDGGAALRLSPDSASLVAGIHVKDPAKLESALKKLESAAKKAPGFPGINWNAANHAGVNFHTMTIPIPEKGKGPRQLFGDNMDVAIGIGPDAAYLALGRDNIDAVSKAIDASVADKEKSVQPFEFAASLKPIMEVAASQADSSPNPEAIKAVADVLKNQAQGRDHIRIVGQVLPNGLRYRFEAEEGVLRAAGTAVVQAQQKKLQANQ